jgi:RNA polymerase sigma-70 factor (ECF subfamily)
MTSNSGPGADRREWVRAALERYERPLVAYASRLAGDRERGRDAVQEAFLRLCAQDRAAVEPQLREWLFTVCRNWIQDGRRKEGRMAVDANGRPELAHAPEPEPADELARREALDSVLSSLAELTADQREALELKFRHGLSYPEIARVTGCSVPAIGWRIHAGLKALREKHARRPGDLERGLAT